MIKYVLEYLGVILELLYIEYFSAKEKPLTTMDAFNSHIFCLIITFEEIIFPDNKSIHFLKAYKILCQIVLF